MFNLLSRFLILSLVFSPTLISANYSRYQKHPKLVVLIVIDQFRADYLTRFQSRFLPAHGKNGSLGGFKYLMTEGAYFPLGQYDLMQSTTSPGHSTVLTGAYPYQSGIPLNEWYNSHLNRMIYSAEDTQSPIVGLTPSQKATTTPQDGMSPTNLNATTVGDELKNAGFPSQVISISIKERSAIFMGGHQADLALWFDPHSNQWVSSQFYLPSQKLPEWVLKLNHQALPKLGTPIEWNLSGGSTGFSDKINLPILDENEKSKGGKTFPHLEKFGSKASIASPLGLELTETAAEKALQFYHLGQGTSTDLLAVSFSSHDMVGHEFGPNSREMEEMTQAEDRILSKLLNAIQSQLPSGLKEVLFVFTGDHGVAPNPEWAVAHKMNAGRIDEKELAATLSEHLNQKFGKPNVGTWIPHVGNFNFYLNLPQIEVKKVNQAAMEAEVKLVLEKDPRAAFVFTSTDYKNRKLPPGILERQILHSYYPGRNGEIIMIAKPMYIPTGATANHITGYSFDRTVPIILAGPQIKPGIYATRAEVVDIAPTLSFLLGVIPPNLSEGRVLSEILDLSPVQHPK